MVLNKQIKVVEHRVDRRRHGPKRGHGNVPLVPNINRPVHVSVSDHNSDWARLKPIEELFHWSSHLPQNLFVEAGRVGAAADLARDHVGDGAEAYVVRLGVRADEAEPFFGNNEGDEKVAFL